MICLCGSLGFAFLVCVCVCVCVCVWVWFHVVSVCISGCVAFSFSFFRDAIAHRLKVSREYGFTYARTVVIVRKNQIVLR